MTLLAGIFALDRNVRPQPAWVEAITRELSRSGDRVETFEDEHLFLAKIDVGAFRDPVMQVGHHVVTMTGDPVFITEDGNTTSRAEAADHVGYDLDGMRTDALLKCNGSFSVCYYNPREHRLLVGTDRMGVRAVYYSVVGSHCFFSSNRRALEQIDAIPKRMDVRAVVETASFGIPLGDRSVWTGVKVLRGGQYLLCAPGHHEVAHYFRLGDIPPSTLDRTQMVDQAYDVFRQAVEQRSTRTTRHLSFLSGGLDSRVVVSALKSSGKEVLAVTFKFAGLLDGVLARDFADRMGVEHVEHACEIWERAMHLEAEVPGALRLDGARRPEFPQLVFSGDGGSVGVGYVYMDQTLVEHLRAGRMQEGIAHYMRQRQLTRRLITPWMHRKLAGVVADSVRHEIARAGTKDPAKAFHIFLMDNDQRRHLHHIYENIDRTRSELLLPFFDGRFVELVNSGPTDWFMFHDFYYEWLKKFPEPTATLPWQAYPGHLPCPIPNPHAAHRDQWNISNRERFQESAAVFEHCRRILWAGDFPSMVLNRPVLMVAMLLHGLRLHNYSYLWDGCKLFYDQIARSNGQLDFDSLNQLP